MEYKYVSITISNRVCAVREDKFFIFFLYIMGCIELDVFEKHFNEEGLVILYN